MNQDDYPAEWMPLEELIDAVAEIMIHSGPDGHSDGCEIIADFIQCVRADKGKTWFAAYCKKNGVTPS